MIINKHVLMRIILQTENGTLVVVIVWKLDLQLPMQPLPILTIAVAPIPPMARCTRYYFMCCQWLAAGRWFSPDSSVSSNNKSDCHDITEILLKVELSTNTLTITHSRVFISSRITSGHLTLSGRLHLEVELLRYYLFAQGFLRKFILGCRDYRV